MIATERHPRTAPIDYLRCPIHQQLVLFDGEGRMLGLCSACMEDAANGLRWLRDHPVAR